jgi:8-amino-7-oxononanoate synthase
VKALLSTGVTDPFSLVMEKVLSPTVAICNGRETILLGTYNYMGMTFDRGRHRGRQAGVG